VNTIYRKKITQVPLRGTWVDLERKTGFEPATTTLARWSSTGLSYFRLRITVHETVPWIFGGNGMETDKPDKTLSGDRILARAGHVKW
jgi:hypothetical protein